MEPSISVTTSCNSEVGNNVLPEVPFQLSGHSG